MNLPHQIRLIPCHLLLVCCVSLSLALAGCTATEVPATAPTSPAPSLLPTETPGPTPAAEHRPNPGLPAAIIDIPDGAYPVAESITLSQSVTAPDRDLFRLAAELKLKTAPDDILRVVNPNPVSYLTGREDTFWLVNFKNLTIYQSEFELLWVSPHAYWYVEKGQSVSTSDLEWAAKQFEDIIYPQVSHAFGQERLPGIDNDPHLNIIHAQIEGVAGYYSSSDEHPQTVYPYSNQRETIYINVRALGVGSNQYLEVLAHELQHAIHWNYDNSEDTWVNEGLSDVAVVVAGYHAGSIKQFLRSPTISLIHWPLNNANVFAHYGGAALFFHYLAEHYSQRGNLQELVKEPADGIAGIDNYLTNLGYTVTFNDVFADWVVANILDEPEGKYGYTNLDPQASTTKTIDGFAEVVSEIPQYSTEYIELTSLPGSVRLEFQGRTETALLPTKVGEGGCWWSNSGDSIGSALTRTIDLRGQTGANLNYQVWHQVEQDWDYGYVQVSTDAGLTWDILPTANTSPENPIGNSFGSGYTGNSQGWLDENIDLSNYAGLKILFRFQYVTDDAINDSGLCFRNISVPETGLVNADTGWQSDGFILINNRVRQDYIVQVIQIDQENQVSTMQLDQDNSDEMVIDSTQGLDRLVVAISAIAPLTLQPAPYTLTVEQAE